MYYVCKRLEISAAHSLMLSYESKCEDLHGHNWIVKIYCKSETLNQDGMVTDFTLIKRDIEKALDHKFLNEVLPMNPTAENIARWICDRTPNAYKVEVWESEMNMAAYERD
jgi:6-pyruvoyltetrahydropterin/6-carboxytetrahydropterin synthase